MDLASLATEVYELNQQYIDIIAQQSKEIAELKAKLAQYERSGDMNGD